MTTDLQNKKILVVEDNRINQKLINTMLARLNASISMVETGQAALNAMTENPPNCVLLDLNLPDMNGFEVMEKLQLSGHNSVPIIILTATSDPDMAAKAIQAGAHTVLVKPVDEQQLSFSINTATENLALPAQKKPIATQSKTPDLHKKMKNPVTETPTTDKTTAKLAALDSEVRTMLAQDLPTQLGLIQTAFSNKDIPVMKDAVHQLHGSAAFCQLAGLKKLTKTMEEKLDKSKMPISLDELEVKINDILSSIKKF